MIFCLWIELCFSQIDSSSNKKVDSFLMHQKGLLGKLARNLVSNKPAAPNTPVRNDLLFMRYRGMIIRNINIQRVDFGTLLSDTSKKFKTSLTKLANDFHHKTREPVISRNLFFKKGDEFIPYLVADNERHLRSLPYLQDAEISVTQVSADTVDITIFTKDILSLGGSFELNTTTRMTASLLENNLGGTGSALRISGFFDNDRNPKFGYGTQYTVRNIAGSFIDWSGSYLSFNKNFTTGAQDEELVSTSLVRPLVNPYIRFTYAASAAWHVTHNDYKTDTTYDTKTRYRYYNYDGWVGWNLGALKLTGDIDKDDRWRTLVGVRYVQQNFGLVPLKYADQYYYQYPDLKAALASVTIFRQDFYKARYVYGFGVNEDIPEGADLSVTTGWTKKAGATRPYVGIDLERYFFTARESYFNYIFKADGYFRNKQIEDVNLLFDVNYFTRLLRLGQRWKQRTFINGSIAHQINKILDEPLFLQSDFGVHEWRYDTLMTGDTRITLKAESAFFTPWTVANFRFAPFVFTDLCLFTPTAEKFSRSQWYNSVGGGLRTRNESLVFQTTEFRFFYFPRPNFLNQHWRIEINTNIRFRFNRQFVKKPDFVSVNVM